MDTWDLEFYTATGGSSPVQEYVDGLPDIEAARLLRSLDLLEQFGVQLGMPHSRKIESSSLWELRIRGGKQHRVFYVAIQGRKILLLHAFGKKTQKTPAREIRTAEQRLRDYQERVGQ